jgi:glycosyltransferase involved in cell wall biosynthesis
MKDQQPEQPQPSLNGQEWPFVSIIIPVYNDLENLKTCLAALDDQTYPKDRYEIIVVDNGSATPVADVIPSDDRVKILLQTKPGPSPTRNAGLAAATGDYLAFIDSDCIPYRDWLENGVNQLLLNPACGLVGGRVDIFPKDPQAMTPVEIYESVYAYPTELNIKKHHFMPTCNLFTFRTVFDRVGPFDETFHLPEDEEWCQRVYAQGYELIYADNVAIRHPARRTFASLRKKVKRITYTYVGSLSISGRRPVWSQYRFFRRLVLLPTPYELRKLAGSQLTLFDKLKALVVVFYFRSVRAFHLVQAAVAADDDRLW